MALITYWCVDLSNEHWYTFFVHTSILILVYLHANSLATICSTLIPDKKIVLLTIPFVNLPLFLFSGFFINRHQVTVWLSPIQYISYYKYGLQALIQNEYDDQDLACLHETDITLKCDPLGDFDAAEGRTDSMIIQSGIMIIFYIIGFFILSWMSKS